MLKNRHAQFTTEYLVVISIGLAIIAIFLIYVFLYYSSYSSGSISNQVATAASNLVQQANYVTSEGAGSKTSFPVNYPTVQTANSYFCGTYIKLTSGSYSNIQQAELQLEGVLPLSAGNYIVYATYDGGDTVQIGLDGAITYINSSYSLSGTTLSYGLIFFNASYLPASGISFNVSVFSPSGTLIGSATKTSGAGVTTGTISLKQVLPLFIVDVFPSGYNLVAPSCFSP